VLEEDDGDEGELMDDDPLDMPELEEGDVPMSLLPEDERVPVELQAASDTAQASSTIHLDISFSL